MKNHGLKSFYLATLSTSKDSYYLIENLPNGLWCEPIPLITKSDEKRLDMTYRFLIEKAREAKRDGAGRGCHFNITIQPLVGFITFISSLGDHITLCEPPASLVSDLNRTFEKNSF